jgi:hypothetical protein
MNAPSVLEIIVLMRPLQNSIIVYPGGCVKVIAAAGPYPSLHNSLDARKALRDTSVIEFSGKCLIST